MLAIPTWLEIAFEISVIMPPVLSKKTKETQKSLGETSKVKKNIRSSDDKNKKKRKNKKRKESFCLYIYKILKQLHPDTGISVKAIFVMNSFIYDVFERLAGEASRLVVLNQRSTMTSNEIQTAVRLILPGDLGKHAMAEGVKAIAKYSCSKWKFKALSSFYSHSVFEQIIFFCRLWRFKTSVNLSSVKHQKSTVICS